MRKLAAAALIAASLTNMPAMAADLPSITSGSPKVDQAAFAGARLRLTLGGKRGGRASASLAVAPMQRSLGQDGVKRRIADGFEFGFASGEKQPVARLAGYRLSQGALTDDEGRRMGLNTLETTAIVGGVILLAGVIAALAVRSDDGCCE